MLAGKVPGPDALLKICRAENARIEFLLTGEGPPYLVTDLRDDNESCEYLKTVLTETNWKGTLLTDPDGFSAMVVLTRATRDEDESGDVAHYTRVEILPVAGRKTLTLLRDLDDCHFLKLPQAEIESLRRGWLGPLYLLGDGKTDEGLLSRAEPLDASELDAMIVRLSGEGVTPEDETQILSCYRRLPNDEKDALLTVASAMSVTRIDVMQAPPGTVVDPDRQPSKRKGHSVRVDRQQAASNKIQTKDES